MVSNCRNSAKLLYPSCLTKDVENETGKEKETAGKGHDRNSAATTYSIRCDSGSSLQTTSFSFDHSFSNN